MAPEADAFSPSAERLAAASWEALGTSVELRLSEPHALAAARTAVEDELNAIDGACSRFREDSELSRLNLRAGRPARVGPLLIEAVELALRAAELTGGDVDPTVGRALELVGYDRDWKALARAPSRPAGPVDLAPAPITARARDGWRTIAIDRAGRTIRLAPGIRIDLGATAKAWAADRAAAAAAAASGAGALVALGGDIAVCGPAPRGGWRVRVTDDHRSACSAPGQTVTIRAGGLATSSTSVRRWQQAGAAMHHIIDPDTGSPVRNTWRTVSVAASSCADANIASTAALVRRGSAPAWLARQGMPARLVDAAGTVTTVGGWP